MSEFNVRQFLPGNICVVRDLEHNVLYIEDKSDGIVVIPSEALGPLVAVLSSIYVHSAGVQVDSLKEPE